MLYCTNKVNVIQTDQTLSLCVLIAQEYELIVQYSPIHGGHQKYFKFVEKGGWVSNINVPIRGLVKHFKNLILFFVHILCVYYINKDPKEQIL